MTTRNAPPAAGARRIGTRYSRAPIAEAVIDVRAVLADQVDLDALGRYQDALGGEYPTSQKRMQFRGQFSMDEGGLNADTAQEQLGFAFVSEDGRQVVQAKLDGFTFSRLAPYETFEPFSAEALRLWDMFEGMFAPGRVTRVGVRYVNRLPLPGDLIELSDYLRTFPEIAPELPQEVGGYFMSLSIPLPAFRAELTMTQTIVDTPEASVLVLDNDVARFMAHVCDGSTAGWLSEVLGDLRAAKNEVFEASITDKVRELIQ